MKKIFFLSALLCASMMTFAIDWSSVEWLGDGAGGGAYAEKYKLAAAEGQEVVNIQQFGAATEPGIYTRFQAAIKEEGGCTLPDGKYMLDGSGMLLYLSAFTQKETEVKVTTADDKEYVFQVFFVDGASTAVETVAAPAKTMKVVENGQLVIIKDGVRFNAAGQQIQ